MDEASVARFRLVAIDLDGTLLDSNHRIHARTVRMLHEVERRGIEIVLASARMPRSILKVARELGIGGRIIAYGGAVVLDTKSGAVLDAQTISPTASKHVLSVGIDAGVHVSLYVDDEWYVEDLDDAARAESRAANVVPNVVQDLGRHLGPGAAKILLVGETARLQRAIRSLERSRVSFSHSKPDYLEVGPLGVSKGSALRRLLEIGGIGAKEAMAIGDNYNDVEMLRTAGCAVVVANAPDEVKQHADYLAPSNDEEGVAFALERLCLVKQQRRAAERE